jgi:hypothetical protein
MNPELDDITITFQTEDSGTIVGEKVKLETLTEYLRDHGVKLLNSIDAPPGLYSIDFACSEDHLRNIVQEWEGRYYHNVEYKSAFAI